MNLKALALATLIGIATPAIADISFNTPAVAQANYPMGLYEDGNWEVSVQFDGNSLTYSGRNKQTGDSIRLYDGRVSGNAQRRIYTWYNSGTRYQVAWRPNDPNYLRVQVFSPNGREILNRLLTRYRDL